MVDALGGVPVCVVPSAATAAAAVPLPAGLSTLSGDAATGFLQPGDTGSDVTGAAVAERAQRLLTSTLRAAMSMGTLTDPLTLTRFLNRAADALTVDEQTTLGDLRVLATSLGDLTGDAVQRAACRSRRSATSRPAPTRPYVLLDRAATRTLFDAMIERRPRCRRSSPRVDEPPPPTAEDPAPQAAPEAPRRPGPRPPGSPCRRPRSPSTSSTAPGRRVSRAPSPTCCGPGLHRRRGRQRGGDGQRDRRPPRPERPRAGPHRRRRGARFRAAAERRDRGHGPAGHRPRLRDRRPGGAAVLPRRPRRRPPSRRPQPSPARRHRRPSAAERIGGSAEAAGDVVLGRLLVGVAEDLLGRVELDQPAGLARPR